MSDHHTHFGDRPILHDLPSQDGRTAYPQDMLALATNLPVLDGSEERRILHDLPPQSAADAYPLELLARVWGAESVHTVPFIEKLHIMACLWGGPKVFTQISRYLYEMAGSEARTTALSEMLMILAGEGLVEYEREHGQFQLTKRGMWVADKGSPAL